MQQLVEFGCCSFLYLFAYQNKHVELATAQTGVEHSVVDSAIELCNV